MHVLIYHKGKEEKRVKKKKEMDGAIVNKRPNYVVMQASFYLLLLLT